MGAAAGRPAAVPPVPGGDPARSPIRGPFHDIPRAACAAVCAHRPRTSLHQTRQACPDAAARLGLCRFDILMELNGVPIRRVADIGPALRRQVAGKPLRAKVMRRANLVEIAEAARAEKKPPAPR